MSHRKDLSRYSADNANILNVGWLDRNEIFPQGETGQEFRAALTEHIRYSAVQTLGCHQCNLCNKGGHHVRINLVDGSVISLGSCEILVFANNKIVYGAPNLIYHYVMDCNYLPPEPFIEAIVRSPRPPSCDYLSFLTRLSETRLVGPLVEMVTGKPIWMPPAFLRNNPSG